jgi:hypothetical protein
VSELTTVSDRAKLHRGANGSPVLISLMAATVAGGAGVYYSRMAANEYSISVTAAFWLSRRLAV